MGHMRLSTSGGYLTAGKALCLYVYGLNREIDVIDIIFALIDNFVRLLKVFSVGHLHQGGASQWLQDRVEARQEPRPGAKRDARGASARRIRSLRFTFRG